MVLLNESTLKLQENEISADNYLSDTVNHFDGCFFYNSFLEKSYKKTIKDKIIKGYS